MLKEAKLAMRVTVDAFDAEIASLLMAGASDLELAGVSLPGTVTFTVDGQGSIVDQSTLTDPLCQRAVITYARMRFGSPADYDRLSSAYETQKVQLMHAAQYTNYGEADAE